MRSTGDIEVDEIAVVDGRVHLIEAKSTSGLDGGEIKQLVIAAECIRPNIVVVACMAERTDALDRAASLRREVLPEGIAVEVITFNSEQLDIDPLLPS